MLSKILAGALGLGVVVVGGAIYFENMPCHSEGGCPLSRQHSESAETCAYNPNCCSDLSRAGAISCCKEDAEPVVSTVSDDGVQTLVIEPREIAK